MAYVKTRMNDASVTAYLNSIEDRARRADATRIASVMRKARARRQGCGARVSSATGHITSEILQTIIERSVKLTRKRYETERTAHD